jgi:transposase
MRLESLEVGAAPVVRHFLGRIGLPSLFAEHLPALPGRVPALSSPSVLCLLLTNLLLARQPLYALAGWAARRVPEHVGLLPGQAALLNDDRIGRALDHLYKADRASLLTALVLRIVREFDIDLSELHQDTTTVTFSGDYADQPDAVVADRPPRITFGYNKDHRPDLKQLLYGITISDDGAVPVHCKIYDGNTTDDQVHQETWSFLRQIVGHANFLYVADSKLCTRENMTFIAAGQGRFLTVMPRTRSEAESFYGHVQMCAVDWQEVHREPNPRRRDGPDVVYHAVEAPKASAEGYRVLWYRSSQKQEQDRRAREQMRERVAAGIAGLQPEERGRAFRTREEAATAAQRVLDEEQAPVWMRVEVEEEVEEQYRQSSKGRPGPNTQYQRVEKKRYRIRLMEDGEGLKRQAMCDGLFPLMTNDVSLSLKDALEKYKYQPFVEKRHEQLKSVFDVMPVWLKSPRRVASLLWLYYGVELIAALLEREVRRRMEEEGISALALYPERRASTEPTAGLVLSVLEGHRRHRLLDEHGQELQRFYDPIPDAAHEVLALLNVDCSAYGLD